MGQTFNRLSIEEREIISIGLAQGKKLREIGLQIGRSHSTISRELQNNTPPVHKGYYLPHKAQLRADVRNSETHIRPRLKNKKLKGYVIAKIKDGWSPELIAGRVSQYCPGEKIGYESIYQYIYAEARELIRFLPRKHRIRKFWGYTRKHAKSHIPGRIAIDKRPSVVNARTRYGDWEADTAVSRASKAAILVLTERKSRKLMITKLSQKTSSKVKFATIRKLKVLPKRLRKTITYDNGSENVEHQSINAVLGTKSFFCMPYHSWEKGSVENAIGLIRRFLPKKTDFSKVSYNEIRKIENLINNRPKKCLNYLTPNEVMSGAIAHGM